MDLRLGLECTLAKNARNGTERRTGTPLYKIRLKSKWQRYLRYMEQGMTIKKIALDLGISIQTSFDWRHKILTSLSRFEPKQLHLEVECDEMELALSYKGNKSLTRKARKRGSDFSRNNTDDLISVVQVVTAVERNGEKYLKAVESKRLSKEEISKVLDGKLAENATLITDKHASYKAFAKDNPSIKHKRLLSSDHVSRQDRSLHLQKVNSTHSQLRKFLRPFNGVSSKYLQNYLYWFAYADKLRGSKEAIKQWLITILMADQGYHLFELFKQNVVTIRI